MLKFHWMHRNQDTSIEYLKSFSDKLNDSGYVSIMYVYDPNNSDYFIKIARFLTVGQNIKYMFAIRTYSISPELLSMVCKSFDEIDTGRMMLNIISGDSYQMLNETTIDGAVSVDVSSSESRMSHTQEFMKKFTKLGLLSHMKNKVVIAMSGSSDKTLGMAEEYAEYNMSMLYMYLEDPKRYLNNKRRMVVCAIVVTETEEEFRAYSENTELSGDKKYLLFGTKDQLLARFRELEELGITDLMLSYHTSDTHKERIHSLVKSMQGNQTL